MHEDHDYKVRRSFTEMMHDGLGGEREDIVEGSASFK